MTFDAQEFARSRNLVLLVGSMAWIVTLAKPGVMFVHVHNPAAAAMPLWVSLRMVVAMDSMWTLARGWLLMIAAMMTPALISPIYHIRMRSFTHRRTRSVAVFVAAYAGIWMVVGALLLAVDVAVTSLAPGSYLPTVGLVLAALLWHCSPIKQICLNRCHAHAELAVFGFAADLAAFRLGVVHALWCAGSCWALMLLPMLLPRGHLFMMAAFTALVLGERIEPPRAPGWQWRFPNRLMRFLAQQVSPGPACRVQKAWSRLADGEHYGVTV